MGLKHLRYLAVLAALLPAPASAQGVPAASGCDASAELVQDDPQFPQVAERLKAKQAIVVVVIGGSSTTGRAAGGGDAAYPHQLELALQRRYPGVTVTVLNKGVAGETADQMAARMERDALGANPALVLWEVGVTDAVRATNSDDFTTTLQAGVTQLHDRRIDVMLIDMQYSPDTSSVINFQPYLDGLHQIGDLTGAYVFRRYDIMKYWSDAGVFNFTDVPKSDRRQLAARVYTCLGERLADAIAYAAR
ncbi:MAG TPA: GDSL-type esterase/lipase family protein [Stellaceae bacterium]|nr:GDSL-type esterase/lipase family protein [Stellaceae bacterium]